MSVPSLTQLAIRRVPLEQIFEQGLLTAPLKQTELTNLQNRITLENLYLEDLLTPDLNPAIFWMALEKISPDLVWFYLNDNITHEDVPSFTPLSTQGLAYLNEINGYSLQESQDATQDALRDILTDFFNILGHPGTYFIIDSQSGFVWDYHNDRYRFFWIPSGPVTYDEAESSGEAQIPIIYEANNLDNFLRIFTSLGLGDVYSRLDFRFVGPNQLEIQQKVGFEALRNAFGGNLQGIYDRLWDEDRAIMTNGNLDLTLSRLGAEIAVIRVIGDYLYLFFAYSQPLYFERQDGNLIIASLGYNPKRWIFLMAA